jgi:hypothetical protein
VPRGAPTAADNALIDACAEAGVTVSRYQLERWRRAGLIDRPVRHGLGRGQGSTSRYPDGTVEQVVALVEAWAGQGVALHAITLRLFAQSAAVPEEPLRAALVWSIEADRQKHRRVRRQGDEAVDKMIRKKSRVSPHDPMLMAYNLDEKPSRKTLRARAARRRELENAAEISAGVLAYDSYGGVDTIFDGLEAMGMTDLADLRSAVVKEDRRGRRTLPAARPYTLARRTARSAPMWRLEAGRLITGMLGFSFAFAMIGAMTGDEEARACVEALEGDELSMWLRTMAGSILFAEPEEFARSVLNLASDETILELGWHYVRLLMPVAVGVNARLLGPRMGEDNELIAMFRKWENAGADYMPEDLPWRPDRRPRRSANGAAASDAAAP